MVSNNFKINECDKCVYAKNILSGYVIACLYVDDMLIIGSCNDIVMATKKTLASHFDLKNMDKADVILRIKFLRHLEG